MARQANFVVSLMSASTQTVTVNYTTQDGTATAPEDYTPISGTLTFLPGELVKTVIVPVRDDVDGTTSEAFYLVLSAPSNGTIGTGSAEAIIPPSVDNLGYADRFRWMYDALKNPTNGYYGPTANPTAPNSYQPILRSVPYHCPERIICEAPDWGHESVSETASFMIGLEVWKGVIDNSWTGYNEAWMNLERIYIPNPLFQYTTNGTLPSGDAYNPGDPADYMPERNTPNQYPTLGDSFADVGVDGLYNELKTTYNATDMYLMHWLIDVDGVYGYTSKSYGDISLRRDNVVFINNYQRGLQESAWETITHPSVDDFSEGGTYGYLPLYSQNKPLYPAAEFDYNKQYRYTCAPDAEARVIQWSFWGNKYAAAAGADVSVSDTKAKKMGDYLRYAMMDKYFRQIGPNRAMGSTDENPYLACHYLISWYVSWGGDLRPDRFNTPEQIQAPEWAFRIGSSESHQGYQAPDIAYYMATGGGGYTPLSPSAGDIWLGSLYRQLEMLRWLQTEQGPIAGGVTNSWLGRYETPTDGRQTHLFYGMYYTYAPVWHDPPSNNWFGFQAWGLQRVADLYFEVSDKTTSLATDVRNKCGVILDRFVNFCLDNVTIGTGAEFSLPDTLNWTSPTAVAGETTTTANLEGVYEYMPTSSWDGTGDFAAFWSGSSVPNPKLKFTIVATGKDLGVASSLIILLLYYAKAKQVMGSFDTAIPNSSHTPRDAYQLAKDLLDKLWNNYRDSKGITREEERSDYSRYDDPIYVPSSFSGTMPNGDPINSGSTFISIRSFMKSDPEWSKVQAYLDNPTEANVPKFTYHRYWAQAEFAMGNAIIHKLFSDLE